MSGHIVSVGSTPVAGHNSHPHTGNGHQGSVSVGSTPVAGHNQPRTRRLRSSLHVSVGSTPVAGHNKIEMLEETANGKCPSALRQ